VKLIEHDPLLPDPLSTQLALVGETPAPEAVTLKVPQVWWHPEQYRQPVTVQLLA
jgi:hypothetical protein